VVDLVARAAILVVVARVHPFSYDVHGYWARMHHLSLHHLPYRDFLWEFPPLTILVVLPARWLSETSFTAVFVAEMVAAEYTTVLLLRRRASDRAAAIGTYWSAVALPLAAQAWFRLDFLSVLLATWALLVVLDRQRAALPITLGFLAKLWPAILVTVALAQRRYRETRTVVIGLVATTIVWFAFSPAGFRAFLRYRHGSGFQIESLIGASVFAGGSKLALVSDAYVVRAGQFGWVDPLLLASWALMAMTCIVIGQRRPVRAVPLAGALVVWLMLLSRILSPQYLVWALPFATLAWVDGERLGSGLFAVAAWLTTVIDWDYQNLVSGSVALRAIVVLRNLLLVAVGVAFLRAGLGHATGDPASRGAAAAS
jgi:hypothetical protein